MGYRKKFFYVIGNILLLLISAVVMILETILVIPGFLVGLIIDRYPKWAKYYFTNQIRNYFPEYITDKPLSR